MTVPQLYRLVPLLVVLAVAAFIDARQRRIPNWLTFGLMSAGLVRAFWLAGIGGLEHSLLGLLTGGSLTVLLFAISALGGGDVKLLAGIGAWLGPGPVLAIFLIESIVGMVIVLIQSAMQGRLRLLFRNSAVIAANFAFSSELGLDNAVESGLACKSLSRPLPFAVPVFIATVLVLSMGPMLGR